MNVKSMGINAVVSPQVSRRKVQRVPGILFQILDCLQHGPQSLEQQRCLATFPAADRHIVFSTHLVRKVIAEALWNYCRGRNLHTHLDRCFLHIMLLAGWGPCETLLSSCLHPVSRCLGSGATGYKPGAQRASPLVGSSAGSCRCTGRLAYRGRNATPATAAAHWHARADDTRSPGRRPRARPYRFAHALGRRARAPPQTILEYDRRGRDGEHIFAAPLFSLTPTGIHHSKTRVHYYVNFDWCRKVPRAARVQLF
jgi:hypothetical protein